MPETNAASSIPPIHIEETIESIAGLHDEHHANATHHQRVVDRITSLLDSANFIAALTVFVVGWVSLNGLASALGYRALDPLPLSNLFDLCLLVQTGEGQIALTLRPALTSGLLQPSYTT